MLAIRDRKGRLWTARLTVDAALILRELGGIDVMASRGDDADAARRLVKPARAADAIYLLCQAKAEALGISDRKFGERFLRLEDRLSKAWAGEVDEFFRAPGPPPKASGRGRVFTADELWQEAYWMAGEAGVAPGPHTFGELAVMAEGRRRAEWGRHAFLLARLGLGKEKPEDLDITGGLKEARRRGTYVDPDAPKLSVSDFAAAIGARAKPPKRFIVVKPDPELDKWPDEIRN